ncbi:MAG: rod shape-determining protein [Acidobacteriota bacterium]|nr:MAG: rod shape-determining protein [Acidobacteriota bacterium]
MTLSLLEHFSRRLGIDLGTANVLICDSQNGILVNEPSVVAIDLLKGKMITAGQEAKRMTGRNPAAIEVLYPLRDGVINHFDYAAEMLSTFLKKAGRREFLCHNRTVICVPTETTPVERRAFRDLVRSVGAGVVHVIEEPMAAAIGAGLPVTEPRGSMIVDFGGGTTEIAVFSLGGVVCSGSVRIGGYHLDHAIIFNLRRRKNFLIGEQSAEAVKIQLGSADGSVEGQMPVNGKDLIRQLPGILIVDAQEVFQAIQPSINLIVHAVKSTVERIPPELTADIADRGLVLAGGGALLKGLDRVIQRETGIPTTIAEQPLLAVVRGTARALTDEAVLNKICLTIP